MSKLILHEDLRSGNCYKIRLTAAHLGIPLERREYDILAGETRTTEFLSNVNPNGRIPVLQIGDRFLPESNAACWYLAAGSHLVPQDRFDQADMLRWMFFEQYSHEPNIATLRFWYAFVGEDHLTDAQRAMIPAKLTAGDAALRLMDEHLEGRQFLVGSTITHADICLYAYTHLAEAGGFDLKAYANILAWLEVVRLQPRHIAFEDA